MLFVEKVDVAGYAPEAQLLPGLQLPCRSQNHRAAVVKHNAWLKSAFELVEVEALRVHHLGDVDEVLSMVEKQVLRRDGSLSSGLLARLARG